MRIKILTKDDLEKYSDEILDKVSANVKKYRELKNYTQMQLALEIGMNDGAYLEVVAELRKNNHHFNIKHIAKISKVSAVPIENFFK